MNKTLAQIKLEEAYKRVYRDERVATALAESACKVLYRLFEGDEEGLDEIATSLLENKDVMERFVYDVIRTATSMIG